MSKNILQITLFCLLVFSFWILANTYKFANAGRSMGYALIALLEKPTTAPRARKNWGYSTRPPSEATMLFSLRGFIGRWFESRNLSRFWVPKNSGLGSYTKFVKANTKPDFSGYACGCYNELVTRSSLCISFTKSCGCGHSSSLAKSKERKCVSKLRREFQMYMYVRLKAW